MGPVEVTAGAVFLVAVVGVGVWVAAARRRRNRRRREEAERGPDDAALRAEVVDRLERAAAQWDTTAGSGAGTVDVDAASQDLLTEPTGSQPAAGPEVRPEVRPEIAPTADEPARHGRPGRRIRVRWHPRA